MGRYFKDTNLIGRVLRFLNLLEPDHMVLSLSKLAIWITFGLLGYVLFYQSEHLPSLLTALGALTGATGNYMYRRYTQVQQGSGPLPDWDDEDCDQGPSER